MAAEPFSWQVLSVKKSAGRLLGYPQRETPGAGMLPSRGQVEGSDKVGEACSKCGSAGKSGTEACVQCRGLLLQARRRKVLQTCWGILRLNPTQTPQGVARGGGSPLAVAKKTKYPGKGAWDLRMQICPAWEGKKEVASEGTCHPESGLQAPPRP